MASIIKKEGSDDTALNYLIISRFMPVTTYASLHCRLVRMGEESVFSLYMPDIQGRFHMPCSDGFQVCVLR